MPLPVWVKEEIYEYEHLCDLLLTARILLYLYSIKGARAERSGCQCSGEIIPNTTSIKWDRIAGGDKSRDEYVFPSFIPSPPPSSMLPTCVLGAHVRCVYTHLRTGCTRSLRLQTPRALRCPLVHVWKCHSSFLSFFSSTSSFTTQLRRISLQQYIVWCTVLHRRKQRYPHGCVRVV